MIHETFLCLTETAFGSHPCRVVSVTYRTLRPFHGGNTGSNPVGDANTTKDLLESGHFAVGLKGFDNRKSLLESMFSRQFLSRQQMRAKSDPGQYGCLPFLCGLANTQSPGWA
jgi:hypothetical protein